MELLICTKPMVIADATGLLHAARTASTSPDEVTIVEVALDETVTQVLSKRLIGGDCAYDCDPLVCLLAKLGVELITPHKSKLRPAVTQDGRALRGFKNVAGEQEEEIYK